MGHPGGRQSVEHVPVPLFAAVMGLGGTSLAWRRASAVWDVPEWIHLFFLVLAAAVMVLVAGAYLAKWIRHPQVASAELHHPVRLAFVPTITIAILVLATGAQDVVTAAATVLWWVGAIGHLLATVWVLSEWSTRPDIGAGHITPAWFIPVVGNVVTPLAARTIGNVELGWFSFGVGVVFWLALLPLVLERVLTHDQVFPQKLLPTWAIFIAPPAVAMLSWRSLTGTDDDAVSRVLYAATIMFVVLVLAQWRRLRAVPFGVPFWAYAFPFASAATAAVAMAGTRPTVVYEVVAVVLLGVASIGVLVILTKNVLWLLRGRLLVAES